MNATPDKPLQILILGDGYEGWLTASRLLNALGERVSVRLCPVDGASALDALYSILPRHADRKGVLRKIDALQLVGECQASYSLGCQLKTSGQQRFIPLGGVGVRFGGLGFHHYWKRAVPLGQQAHSEIGDYFNYAPATRAARREAYAPPVDQNAIGDLQHESALHVDIGRLTTLLKHQAMSMGAELCGSSFSTIERDTAGDRITAIEMSSGERQQADLYLDCSGDRRILGAESFQSASVSADYQLDISQLSPLRPPVPWHSVQHDERGWTIRIPRADSVQEFRLRPAPIGGGHLRIGHQVSPWQGNTVSLGLAAAQLLPFDSTQHALLSLSLRRLVALMPAGPEGTAEAQEYNHLFAQEAREAHEFQACLESLAHYTDLDTAMQQQSDWPETLMRRLQLLMPKSNPCLPNPNLLRKHQR